MTEGVVLVEKDDMMVFGSSFSASNITSISVDLASDPGGSLEWLTVDVNGVSFYTQFLSEAVIDNTTRRIVFKYNESDDTIIAIAPHFWYSLYIDPDFSILINQTLSSPSSTNILWLAMVLSVIVGAIIIVIIVVAIIPKIKLYIQVQDGKETIQKSDEIEVATLDGNTHTDVQQERWRASKELH